MSNEIVAQLTVRQGKDLHETIPPARDDEGHALAGTESHTGHPFGVSLGIRANGILAFSQCIPQLDGLVARSADNLTVVDAECHAQDILGMPDKSTSGASTSNFPQAEGTIPASRQCKLAVTRDDHVGNEVRVSSECAFGVAVGIVPAGSRVGEPPHQNGFIARSREDEIGIFGRGGDAGDPIAVAGEGAAQAERFGHGRDDDDGLDGRWMG